MKKTFLYLTLALFVLLIFTAVSCNEPVFYNASIQIPLRPPLIDGSPSKLVKFDVDNSMYAASGKVLYWFNDGDWNHKNFPSWIRDIAATEKYLYVCMDKTLQRFDGSDWESIETGLNMQKIFGAKNYLYISSGASSFAINYISDADNAASPVSITNGTATMLISAAVCGNDIFLCSKDGIFFTAVSAPQSITMVSDSNGKNLTGIINPGNSSGTIFAIDYNGNLYTATSAGFNADPIAGFKDGRRTTGALTVYSAEGNSTLLLLVGRMDVGYAYNTGYVYGYVEIKISSDMLGITGEFSIPGNGDPTTVEKTERYNSSLGKNPVNSIYQYKTPQSNILFASTQKRGVWSYRNRGSDELPDWYWNAEE